MTSILARGRAPSTSRPGHWYPMALTASGWQHDGEGCRWYYAAGYADKACRHVLETERIEVLEMSEQDGAALIALGRERAQGSRGASLIVRGEQVAIADIIEEFPAELVVTGVDPKVIEEYCYAFKPEGSADLVVGISTKGAARIIREMAKRGEIVKVDRPEVVRENDEECFFDCRATRFILHPETGERIELDSQTRGLRQEKFQRYWRWEEGPNGRRRHARDAQGNELPQLKRPDPKWWEKGYSKAQRNAALPMLRADAVTAVLRVFRETDAFKKVSGTDRQLAAPDRGLRLRDRVVPPASAAKATPPQINQIQALAVDLNSSQPREYLALLRELAGKYPAAFKDGKWSDPRQLTEAQAAEIIAIMRKAQAGGELPPEPAPEEEAHDPDEAEPTTLDEEPNESEVE